MFLHLSVPDAVSGPGPPCMRSCPCPHNTGKTGAPAPFRLALLCALFHVEGLTLELHHEVLTQIFLSVNKPRVCTRL